MNKVGGNLFAAFENGGSVGEDDSLFKDGGIADEATYEKWKSLVNMTKKQLQDFYNSKEGRVAGLSASEAKEKGIDSGRESARWIMKMKDTPVSKWTPAMWKWAKKQISFISRMSGLKGGLYDDKGNKTRKHTSLLIWGHNPKSSLEKGGVVIEDVLPKEKTAKYLKNKYPKRLKPYREISEEADAWATKYMQENGIKNDYKLTEFFRLHSSKVKELEKKYNGDKEEIFSGIPLVYLRLGLPHTNKKNKIIVSTGFNGQVINDGVSVFEAGYDPDSGFIVVYLGGGALTLDWYEGLAQKRKIYLVEGENSGNEGYDGEVLLVPSTVEVVGEIDGDNVVVEQDEFDGETASEKEIGKYPVKYRSGGEVKNVKESKAKLANEFVVTETELVHIGEKPKKVLTDDEDKFRMFNLRN